MKKPIPFLGDPSATTASAWMQIPPQTKRIAIGVGTTTTGTPAGQHSIEVSNHGQAGVAGTAILNAQGTAPTITATNGAVKQLIDNLVTAAQFIRTVYTRTSGGTGSVFTDDSGVAGSVPIITFKE